MTEFEQFILDHGNDDIPSLLLTRSQYPDIDLKQACLYIECRRKIRDKVPVFHAETGIRYVSKLSAEQCSSQATARYKAQVAAEILTGNASRTADTPKGEEASRADNTPRAGKIADLTGGMGIDALAFAGVASEVLYNEMNPALAEATAHNFSLLGIKNVRVTSHCLISMHAPQSDSMGAAATLAGPGSDTAIEGILGDFQPDLIYLDPARRDSSGSKVFRLEDCSPNILKLKEELLARSRHLLLKLSPMADISAVSKALGPEVSRIILVASEGECKELLVLLDGKHQGEYLIQVHNETPGRQVESDFIFAPQEENRAIAQYAPSLEAVRQFPALFEPGKALLKAGAFKLISERFGLTKLAASTHLYGGPIEALPPAGADIPTRPDALPAGLGRCWRIEQVMPFSSHTLKTLGSQYPPMDVTARNLPLTSEALRQRLWGKNPKGNKPKPDTPSPNRPNTPFVPGEPAPSPGERYHLFALACEDAAGRKERLIFLCTPLPLSPVR